MDKFKLIIRKGALLMQAWATGYTTALHIARAYTDRGHAVTVLKGNDLSNT